MLFFQTGFCSATWRQAEMDIVQTNSRIIKRIQSSIIQRWSWRKNSWNWFGGIDNEISSFNFFLTFALTPAVPTKYSFMDIFLFWIFFMWYWNLKTKNGVSIFCHNLFVSTAWGFALFPKRNNLWGNYFNRWTFNSPYLFYISWKVS